MRKLLIVDDDASLANVYARIAEEAGFTVKVVSDPMKATEAFLDFRPEIAVLDIIMPEKDGIDVLNELLLADTATRIIVTSGHGEAMLRLAKSLAEFHASDRVSVMKKPVRRADFIRLLTGAC
jgi:DNA-binding response OmpR family regulator